jgi:Caspase domain
VFDACRNNLKLRATGSRALLKAKGFVPLVQEAGMLIAYATAEGELASDAGEGAGPYAKALVEEIVKPGVEAVAMFRIVQRRVRAAINQEPYLGFNALGDVYLAGIDASNPRPRELGVTEAARDWPRVDKANIEELERFVERYRGTPEADYARWRVDSLRQQEAAATRPASSVYIPGGPMSGVRFVTFHTEQQKEQIKRKKNGKTEKSGSKDSGGNDWVIKLDGDKVFAINADYSETDHAPDRYRRSRFIVECPLNSMKVQRDYGMLSSAISVESMTCSHTRDKDKYSINAGFTLSNRNRRSDSAESHTAIAFSLVGNECSLINYGSDQIMAIANADTISTKYILISGSCKIAP